MPAFADAGTAGHPTGSVLRKGKKRPSIVGAGSAASAPSLNPEEESMIARRFSLALIVAATLAAAGCGDMPGMSDSKPLGGTMNVPLSGKNEVPPNNSTAVGMARLDLSGTTLKWNITYSGTTGPVTAGHFHGPAAAGANAGVVLPFTGSMASPIEGSATLTQAQLDQFKGGLWYVNLHTAAHPGGELRGQVK